MIDLTVTPLDSITLQVASTSDELEISAPPTIEAIVSVPPKLQILVEPSPEVEIIQLPASTIQIGLLSGIEESAFSAQTITTPFSFGDASPKPIAILSPDQTVFTAAIVIQEAFDGVGASLALGDTGLPDRLIQASQIDPSIVAEHETNPGYAYSTATQILLTITPGEGCTQGSGYVLLEV